MIPTNMSLGGWLRAGASLAIAVAATLPLAVAGGVGTSFCHGDSGGAGFADFFGCQPCPCTNEAPAGARGGCLNSGTRSAVLSAEGSASVSTGDLRFVVESANRGVFVILSSADNRLPAQGLISPCTGMGMSSAFSDGLRCIGGNVLRHGVRVADDLGEVGDTTPGWGGVDAPGSLAMANGFAPGRTRQFQATYREEVTFGCGTGRNTTNAVSVVFVP